jgi:hypothetical protein
MTTGRINQIAHPTLPVRGKRPRNRAKGRNAIHAFPVAKQERQHDTFSLPRKTQGLLDPSPNESELRELTTLALLSRSRDLLGHGRQGGLDVTKR